MRWVTLSAVILAAIATTTHAQGFFTNFLNTIDSHDNYEAAPYTVIESTGQFEERKYPANNWACTEKQGKEGENMGSGMFMKLFRYISRGNVGGESIKMTVPVSTQVSKGKGVQTIKHRMCFYIGQAHQANPPKPTDKKVVIENREEMTIFTRKRPGYMNENAWKTETKALKDILTTAGKSFTSDHTWNVGYDSPMKFWDRRNEVWVQKTEV